MRKRKRASREPWARKDRPDLAIERILSAAEKAFVEVGVSAASMDAIADAAGCSRGTLYRYFPTRHDLHVAYVERTALAIERQVRASVASLDPREQLVAYILGAVRAVRGNPATAAWFVPGDAGVAARMSRSEEVVARLTAAFAREVPASAPPNNQDRLRRRWVVRVIVSLLSDPASSPAEERALVERFVLPGLLAASEGAG
jgi:AcrR family transcriptional regulator